VGPTRVVGGRRRGDCSKERRANESFHAVNTAWKGDLACHVGQNGKYVAKISLLWQMCKLNSKSDCLKVDLG
jgi:hypothetical protein